MTTASEPKSSPDLLIALVTVVVLGGGAWFFLSRSGSNTTNNTPPTDLKNAGDVIVSRKPALPPPSDSTPPVMQANQGGTNVAPQPVNSDKPKPAVPPNPVPMDKNNPDKALVLKADGNKPEFEVVGFDVLASYIYEDAPADESAQLPGMNVFKNRDQIPKNIHALDKKKVAIQGYMVPWKFDEKTMTTTGFMLVKNTQLCCYGKMPMLNEYVIVKMADKPAPLIKDRLLTVYGTLEVGEKTRDGLVTSIYNLSGTEVMADDDL